MNKTRDVAATIGGAVIGGIAGYLFFTDRGRSLRRRIERAIEGAPRELSIFRDTLVEAAALADEGWKLLTGVPGAGARPLARHPHDQSPL